MSHALRGRPIRIECGRLVFADTGLSTADTWAQRTCGACERPNRSDGHDACLGELTGVRNACCGHGRANEAYVQFGDGSELRGEAAVAAFQRLKTDNDV